MFWELFQTALQWLVHLPKLSKHHWFLWIKRCNWAHGISLTHTWLCDYIRFVELSNGKKKRCYSSYLEDDDLVTVMLLHTFSISSTVLIYANSYKNTLSAKQIVEAKWYCRIFNLDTSIPFCQLLTLNTPKHYYICIFSILFSEFWQGEFAQQSTAFFVVIISSILMTFMFNLGMILQGGISS